MNERWGFSPQAQADLARAAEWYESQRTGLGATFTEAVEGCLRDVQRMPGRGTLVLVGEERLRRVFVRGFPYYLLFAEWDDAYVVLAVAHRRQSDERWRARVAHARRP